VSAWTWAWIGWGVYFAVVEGVALFDSKPGNTLSEHFWLWMGYDATGAGARRPSGWTRLRRFLLLAFLAWLVAHFLTGGFF
jgi:hypothetical protein